VGEGLRVVGRVKGSGGRLRVVRKVKGSGRRDKGSGKG